MPKGFHIGWTGREYDAETGLSFHRARYYSAELRRWTQEDPIGYGGGGNLYSYVGGAVLAARDPSGMIADCSEGACGNPHDWSGVAGMNAAGEYIGGGGTWGERASRARQFAALMSIAFSELRGRMPTLVGTRAEIAKMEAAWKHAVFSLRMRAEMGWKDAAIVAATIAGRLGSGTPYVFVAEDFGPDQTGTGYTNAHETTMHIDIQRIESGAYSGNLASTMIHEFGHAAYNTSAPGQVRWNYLESDRWAMEFENAYRRAVGACLRSTHEEDVPWRGSCPH